MTGVTINVPNVGQVDLDQVEYHFDRVYKRWWFAVKDSLGRDLEVPLSSLTVDQARWLATGKQGTAPGAAGLDQKKLALMVVGGTLLAVWLINKI